MLKKTMVRSSFHGKIAEIPGISVDNFERPNIRCRAYFLSHCHTDHTVGLYDVELLKVLQETEASIYMSEPTAAIIRHETNGGPIMKYIKVLKLETTLVILPAIPNQMIPELYVYITLIPAGHCFGSVMFLFKMPNRNVLYTGDFRINQNDITKYGQFHDKDGDPIKIDAIYADTTFIDDKYVNFPKRSVSVAYALDEIKRWLESDTDNRVAIQTKAKYAYEFFFNEIHDKLHLKVYVDKSKWDFYRTVSDLVPGVTDDADDIKIHLCSLCWPGDHRNCIRTHESKYKYLLVYLSAMKWGKYNSDDSTFCRVSEKRLEVCFPTHCSRSELISFISYLSPKKIEGFPKAYVINSPSKESGDSRKFEGTPKKRKMATHCSSVGGKPVIEKVESSVLKSLFDI